MSHQSSSGLRWPHLAIFANAVVSHILLRGVMAIDSRKRGGFGRPLSGEFIKRLEAASLDEWFASFWLGLGGLCLWEVAPHVLAVMPELVARA